MRAIKENMAMIIVVTIVVAAGAYLLWPESPFAKYEPGLERVEKNLKGGVYQKATLSMLEKLKSASEVGDYQALLTDEWESSLIEQSDTLISRIKTSAAALRKFESMDDTPKEVSALNAAVIAMKAATRELGTWRDSESEAWLFIAQSISGKDAIIKQMNDAQLDYQIQEVAALSVIKKMIKKYPEQAERLGGMKSQLEDFNTQYDRVKTFYAQSSMPSNAQAYLDVHKIYKDNGLSEGVPRGTAKRYKEMAEQLDKTYMKVLIEANEAHSVKMAGVTWDNFYDYPTEHKMTYSYVTLSRGVKKSVMSEFGRGKQLSKRSAISNRNLIRATNNGIKQGWSSGDDEGEFWVEDDESEYTHLYKIITNEDVIEVEESVTEAMFIKHQNDVGKAILSKPLGKFEDEVVDMATDPGLAFVGNSQYGQWQQGGVNGPVWMWFPIYSNFGSSRYYYRSDYDRYRSRYNRSYTPIRSRSNYQTNRFGVVKNGQYSGGISNSGYRGGNTLRSSGSSTRNVGPGRGK